MLRERTGLSLDLRYIVDVDFTHARRLGLSEKLYCKSLAQALADPKVSVVVELIGGTTIARKTIEQALAAGKHVVTANQGSGWRSRAGTLRTGPEEPGSRRLRGKLRGGIRSSAPFTTA